MKINTDEIRKHFSIYNCTCPVTIFVLCDEIDRLNKEIKWEQNRLERQGTHWDGCWQAGHKHYECALNRINENDQKFKNE